MDTRVQSEDWYWHPWFQTVVSVHHPYPFFLLHFISSVNSKSNKNNEGISIWTTLYFKFFIMFGMPYRVIFNQWTNKNNQRFMRFKFGKSEVFLEPPCCEIWGHVTNMISLTTWVQRHQKEIAPHPQETLGRSHAKNHHPGTHYFPWQKVGWKGHNCSMIVTLPFDHLTWNWCFGVLGIFRNSKAPLIKWLWRWRLKGERSVFLGGTFLDFRICLLATWYFAQIMWILGHPKSKDSSCKYQ